jgi:hypothetical protein
VVGKWPKELTERGEREDVVPLSFAMILGELRNFLSGIYDEVELTDEPAAAAGDSPVIALGGPLANEVTARLAEQHAPPLWFRGLPYGADSERSIGTGEDAFMPRIADDGSLASDVGLLARIVEPGGRLAIVIAGCFGAGTLGAARHHYLAENLADLPVEKGPVGVESVVRSRIRGWDVSATELVSAKAW